VRVEEDGELRHAADGEVICASRKMVNYVVLPYTTVQWRKFGVVDVIQRQNVRGSFIFYYFAKLVGRLFLLQNYRASFFSSFVKRPRSISSASARNLP
jgi:hypothetical protein